MIYIRIAHIELDSSMRRIHPADLTTFLSIAKHRNFRRAAEELQVTPSALSHALRNLEEQIDIRLFNRTSRSVALTEAGERLHRRVQPAFRENRGSASMNSAASRAGRPGPSESAPAISRRKLSCFARPALHQSASRGQHRNRRSGKSVGHHFFRLRRRCPASEKRSSRHDRGSTWPASAFGRRCNSRLLQALAETLDTARPQGHPVRQVSLRKAGRNTNGNLNEAKLNSRSQWMGRSQPRRWI